VVLKKNAERKKKCARKFPPRRSFASGAVKKQVGRYGSRQMTRERTSIKLKRIGAGGREVPSEKRGAKKEETASVKNRGGQWQLGDRPISF